MKISNSVFVKVSGPLAEEFKLRAIPVQTRPGILEMTLSLTDGSKIIARKFFCQVCMTSIGPDNDFVVKDPIWRESGLQGNICMPCFQKVLGRELENKDLKVCAANYKWLMGLKPWGGGQNENGEESH